MGIRKIGSGSLGRSRLVVNSARIRCFTLGRGRLSHLQDGRIISTPKESLSVTSVGFHMKRPLQRQF